jgi:hypothetical protein
MKRNHLLAAFAALLLGVVVVWAASGDIEIWTGMGSRRNTVEFKIATPTIGSPSVFVPGTNNANALGTTALRFSNIYTTLLNVSGLITASTGLATPTLVLSNVLDITVSTPSAVGQMGVTSAGVLYVATSAVTTSSWVKVGAQ